MKRSPLARGTKPLTRTTTLPRGGRLARGQLKSRTSPGTGVPGVQMQGTSPDPELPARTFKERRSTLNVTRRPLTADEREAKRIVRERSQGWCETGCGRRAQSFSHRVAASQCGPNSVVNGLDLCSLGSGDPGCHTTIGRTNITVGLAGRWRLNSWDDPATTPVWIRPSEAALNPGWYLLLPDGGIEESDCGWDRPVMPWEAP